MLDRHAACDHLLQVEFQVLWSCPKSPDSSIVSKRVVKTDTAAVETNKIVLVLDGESRQSVNSGCESEEQ